MKHSRQENSSRRLRKQTVVFVRHGVARHNIINPQTGKPPDLTDPNLLDPPLVRDGKFQAIIVGERLKAWWINEQGSDAQLVISSPLTRCLQTANLAYLPGDLYPMGRNEPTIVCMEGVREAYGMHYPDKRRNKSFLESQWRNVHFDPNMKEEDNWQPDKREHYNDIMVRINQFLDFLVQRPEDNIVVVSHGVWIECCFHAHFPSVLANGTRVYNCDMYAADCISESGRFVSLQNVRRIE